MITIPSTDVAAAENSLLTAADVAARLNIAKTSTYELLAQGRLAHYRVGRLVRIRETDLLAYLESARVLKTNPPPTKYDRYPQT